MNRIIKLFARWHVVWARLDTTSMQAWKDGKPIPVYNVTEYLELRFWRWTLDERVNRFTTFVTVPDAGSTIIVQYQTMWLETE